MTDPQRQEKQAQDSNKALIRGALRSAVRLALLRHNIELEPDAATEDEIAEDAAGACFGEETCDSKPIPEVAEIMRRLEPSQGDKGQPPAEPQCGRAIAKTFEELKKLEGQTITAVVQIGQQVILMTPSNSIFLNAAAPLPETAPAAKTQKEIDISNLRFYAKMAAKHAWGTDIIHWTVVRRTLEEISDRLADLENRAADYGRGYAEGIMAERGALKATRPAEPAQQERAEIIRQIIEATGKKSNIGWEGEIADFILKREEEQVKDFAALTKAALDNLRNDLTAANERIRLVSDMLRHYLKCGYLPHLSAQEAEVWLESSQTPGAQSPDLEKK